MLAIGEDDRHIALVVKVMVVAFTVVQVMEVATIIQVVVFVAMWARLDRSIHYRGSSSNNTNGSSKKRSSASSSADI